MTVCFLGDSITEGYLIDNPNDFFVNQVGKMLNAKVYNCGLCSTRIARRKVFSSHSDDLDFNLRFDSITVDADYLFVFGGTNDYGHGDAEIGKITDKTVFTYCGAINCLINKAVKKFGKDRVVFMLPLKRFNQSFTPKEAGYSFGTLVDFVEAQRKVLEKRKIKYIDLYSLFDEPITEQPSLYFIDGLHPNEKGHKIIAEKIVEFIKNDKRNPL